ncbi:MAG: DUF1566 domain-containing protein, partial [Flavobacteriaceae bacterium]|nr:DUF1566 domain-containing protein [Flavobacteriaceae bacterium]
SDYSASLIKINSTYFTGSKSNGYWSSNISYADSNFAWFFNFSNGNLKTDYGLNGSYSLCVRGGISNNIYPQNRFTDNLDNTVKDNKIGVVWQKVEATSKDWTFALGYCEGLTLGGFADWRLPNIKELRSLADVSSENPAIDVSMFSTASSAFLWSSTTNPTDPTKAYFTSFQNGEVGSISKNSLINVRCIRAGY